MTRKKIFIILLCIVIAGMGVIYASLSQSLNISSTSTVASNTWNIVLTNTSTTYCEVTGNASVGTPTVNGTEIIFNGLVLRDHGDSITCTFRVLNTGTVDAKLYSVSILTPTYEGVGQNKTADEELISENITTSFSYSDGTQIATNNSYANVAANTGYRDIKMTATYSGNSVPMNDVIIKNVGIVLSYQQA